LIVAVIDPCVKACPASLPGIIADKYRSGFNRIVFGVAITLSHIVGRWIGAIGIFAGVVMIAAGVEVAYVGFASSNVGLGANSVIIYWIWILILGAFMWRKSMSKKVL
jgi:hypothetical protein